MKSQTAEQSPTFSVVIPCFNEGRYVGRLLGDLAEQTGQPAQVVVADCSSVDNTVAVAKGYAVRLPLEIIQSIERSIATARNVGAAAVRSSTQQYLVFIDADVRVPRTFLEDLHQVLIEHPVDFATPVFNSDGRHFLDSFVAHSVNRASKRAIERQHKVAGIGCVMVVRKTMHDVVGGFPLNDAHEDTTYVQNLAKQHASAYYAENIVVTNSSRRVRRDGALGFLRSFTPDLPFAKKALARMRGKKYGHYEDMD